MSETVKNKVWQLRGATVRDIDQVVAFEAPEASTTWDAKALQEQFSLAWSHVQIVENISSQLVGYMVWWHVADELQLLNIVTALPQRGQGVGTFMLAELQSQAIARGCSRVVLEVRSRNMAARRLYERAGFVVSGTRPHYYSDTGEDAVLMELLLFVEQQ